MMDDEDEVNESMNASHFVNDTYQQDNNAHTTSSTTSFEGGELTTSTTTLEEETTTFTSTSTSTQLITTSEKPYPLIPLQNSSLSMMSEVCDTAERALRFISSYINSIPTIPLSSEQDFEGVVIVEVLQINWYWRQQRRNLKFLSTHFSKIHPYTNEVRGVYHYENITQLCLMGNTEITIVFKAGKAEYFQGDNVQRVKELILERSRALNLILSVSEAR